MKKSIKTEKRNYVLILASGGIDSTACIEFYNALNYQIDLLFADFGQPSAAKEQKALTKIAEYYRINSIVVQLNKVKKINGGLINGRNAFLYFMALMNFGAKNGVIASGIHAGTNYYDCSPDFFKMLQKSFNSYTTGTIEPSAPFLNFSKLDIYNYCILKKVPIHLTYSCELGKKQPCGHCETCLDLIKLYDSTK